MTKAAAKRSVGRPIKPAAPGQRFSLGLKVTAEIKQLIDALARKTGRTQSQQVELMVEGFLQFQATLAALRTSLTMLEKDGVELRLYRKGWRPISSSKTPLKLWAPPGYPAIEPGDLLAEDQTSETDAAESAAQPRVLRRRAKTAALT
ncbi:hypothetical protein SAMN05519103_01934 [Rhizobiales bacterium GAS113]|nr:hypothetical protein SAMN05519103_01934 [Rhizobiales bacterium GAS113]